MQMDAGLDTGPVLRRPASPIGDDDDAGEPARPARRAGAGLIVEALGGLVEAARAAAAAEARDDLRAQDRKARDAARLARPAAELERAVRAFRPTPGAATPGSAANIKIWRPGGRGRRLARRRARSTSLVVACGEGALAIVELQRAGGRRLSRGRFSARPALAGGARFE